ncbi:MULTISPECIES: hypothetical protein [unclassified Pseudomonas]|uniref:hypothetical protein n=1 Tax=unclassified Pseudomonas TaxID=196821 RepID=UPI001CBA998D|nr:MULTISPECIES: hypothetical protein [unclassified Pseudomonas]
MSKNAFTQARHDVIPGQMLGLIGFVACVILASLALSALATYFQIGSNAQVPVFAAERIKTPSQLNPEPVEKTVFIMLAALGPIGLVAAAKFLRGFNPSPLIRRLLAVSLSAILVTPFIASDFVNVLFFPLSVSNASRTVMLALALLLSAFVLLQSWMGGKARYSSMTLTIGTACAAALVFQIAPYRLASDHMVTLAAQWSVSYDAATYALTQVVAGKTLLSDLPSQYGLFPELIAPIFKIVGISVFSVNTFFIILQVVGLTCIAAILYMHVRNSLLRAMTFVCLLISTSLFLYLNGIAQEIYLQYYPIRFICPAVALLLFARYCMNPSRASLAVLGVASGIAIFWNFDSGIPVLVSIGATLLVKPFFTQPLRWKVLLPVMGFSSFAALTFGALMIALRIKAGGPLGIQEAIASQKLFYGSGFMMLPMPQAFHPWQIILVIYAAAAVAALSAWRRHIDSHVYDVLFCAALMGLGLFTYYQGRSHIFCLMMVLWPALIIGAILTDLILRSIRERSTSPISSLLALPFLIFVSLGTVTLAFSAGDLVTAGINNLKDFQKSRDPVVDNELAFLRSTNNGRDCLILAQRQAIYHAELQTASPLPGPGMIETLLQSDLDALMAGALSNQLKCIYLGVGPSSQTLAQLDDAKLLSKYPVSATNDLGTLLLLEPAPASTASY